MNINKKFFRKKNILITGGTGTFGIAMTKFLISIKAKSIFIYSRDEMKQWHMKESSKTKKYKIYFRRCKG